MTQPERGSDRRIAIETGLQIAMSFDPTGLTPGESGWLTVSFGTREATPNLISLSA
jgi:hypothetical protein